MYLFTFCCVKLDCTVNPLHKGNENSEHKKNDKEIIHKKELSFGENFLTFRHQSMFFAR